MDEKDSVASFLNEVSEPRDLFKEETVAEETAEEEVKEDKPTPFHQDPKVQRYIDKQVEKALKDKNPTVENQFKKDIEDINLPSSFVKLVGNDTPEKLEVLKDLSNYFSTLKGEAKQDFIREMQEKEQQKVEADKKAQQELDNYFDEIEETYSVDLSSNSAPAKAMRSQFIDYVRKIAPKDENGEVTGFPDLVASFEEFQEKNKRPAATRAKELANRGMTRSSDTSTGVPQGRSWKDVDRFFDTLKKTN